MTGTTTPAADPAAAAAATAAAAAIPPGTSLIDTVPDPAAAQKAADTPPAGDGKAAERPQRPDYVPEQFWDPEKGEAKIQDLAKSWGDLRAKIGRGEAGAPKDPGGYVVPKPEGITYEIPADDPVLGAFRKAAHARGLSQADFDAVMGSVLPELQRLAGQQPTKEQQEAETKARVAEEMKKLGPTAEAQVKQIATWGRGLKEKGLLSEAEWDEFRYAAGSADGVRMLSKLMELSGQPPIPIDPGAAFDGAMSQADAEKLMTDGYAKNDMALVEKGRKALEELDRRGMLVRR